ncbi:MAG: TylF/MycF/NovP-related O-methyltransferase [Patescibacteria group bacterium]
MNNEIASFKDEKFISDQYNDYLTQLRDYIDKSSEPNIIDKFENFSKFSTRTSLMRFIIKYEIFKKILNIHGSIFEFGVNFGGGLMTFARLSEILEPYNHQRKIIGFDSFSGFPSISDKENKDNSLCYEGSLAVDSYDDIQQCIRLFNINRPMNHISKVELIKGDICETLPKYINENPHTMASLVILDTDLYEPTKIILDNMMKRIVKGGIILFDQLNIKAWSGESVAVIEEFKNLNNLKIERFPFTAISYAVIGR